MAALVAIVLMFAAPLLLSVQAGEDLTYDEFLEKVEAGEVDEITIGPDGDVTGTLEDGTEFTTVIPEALRDEQLAEQLRDSDVSVDARTESNALWNLLIGFGPILLLIAAFIWLMRRSGSRMSQITGIGQTQAKVITTERPDTTFDDVAGYDDVKEEVREMIDYLKNPAKYRRAGARGPGGVLLVGPPGTGKTLIARAVAGEADVPFLSVEGSTFVEMLVGVGASRVRDLFKEARNRAPSIIFIDELDSVGRKRGGTQTIGAHNEQEQTLNQLLAEMDGFSPAEEIVVMAATNRPEMLDAALLRPGRFDRRLEVPLPRRDDRRAILKVHTRGKPIDDDVDLTLVARMTPGFSGADLENLVNEAAITAVRDERNRITQRDFEEARDRIMLGQRQDSSVLRPEEQRRVAVHEAGHAVVAALSEEADPVEKVTILPARRALGTTEQLPIDERRLHVEGYLLDTLAIRLGGRAAELTVLGQASTGSANDLKGATQIATKMVRDFGLSDRLGPVGYAEDAGFLQGEDGQGPTPLQARPFAEETQRVIDEEVSRLLREAEKHAIELVERNRDALDNLVQELLDEETVDGDRVYELVGREKPT